MVVSKNIIISALAALTVTTTCFADDTTWNFRASGGAFESGSNIHPNSYGNELTFNEGGVELTITAWADTDGNKVDTATAAQNSWGLLNFNQGADGHYVDNGTDTDMLLLSFDRSVSLSSIQLGYFKNDSDITIAAFDTAPTLAGNTWSQVASNAFFTASFADIGTSVLSMSNTIGGALVEAQYWLLGAYNSAFDSSGWSLGNDFLKIASVTTTAQNPTSTPPTSVAEPSALALFASLGLFMLWRRKTNI